MSPRLTKRPPSPPDFSLLTELKKLGYQTIVGVDEVGRGALAGPVVVAAVEVSDFVDGVRDSKQVTKTARALLAEKLHRTSSRVCFGQASSTEIDQLGMTAALALAYARALKNVQADLVLTDHYSLPTKHKFIRATKGDSLFYPVAAASIVAKVYRDQLMAVYARFFPGYGWAHNAGYGTGSHQEMIKQLGLTSLHRRSFTKK